VVDVHGQASIGIRIVKRVPDKNLFDSVGRGLRRA